MAQPSTSYNSAIGPQRPPVSLPVAVPPRSDTHNLSSVNSSQWQSPEFFLSSIPSVSNVTPPSSLPISSVCLSTADNRQPAAENSLIPLLESLAVDQTARGFLNFPCVPVIAEVTAIGIIPQTMQKIMDIAEERLVLLKNEFDKMLTILLNLEEKKESTPFSVSDLNLLYGEAAAVWWGTLPRIKKICEEMLQLESIMPQEHGVAKQILTKQANTLSGEFLKIKWHFNAVNKVSFAIPPLTLLQEQLKSLHLEVQTLIRERNVNSPTWNAERRHQLIQTNNQLKSKYFALRQNLEEQLSHLQQTYTDLGIKPVHSPYKPIRTSFIENNYAPTGDIDRIIADAAKEIDDNYTVTRQEIKIFWENIREAFKLLATDINRLISITEEGVVPETVNTGWFTAKIKKDMLLNVDLPLLLLVNTPARSPSLIGSLTTSQALNTSTSA